MHRRRQHAPGAKSAALAVLALFPLLLMAPARAADDSPGAAPAAALPAKPELVKWAPVKKKPYEPLRPDEETLPATELEMFAGETRVFRAPNVGRLSVGNGNLMSAAVLDDNEVILFANAPGTSSLFIWNKDGRVQRVKIRITPGDQARVQRDIAAFLGRIPQITATVVGDQVIVEGENLSDADQEKIQVIAKRYPQVVDFTGRVGWEKMILLDVRVVEFPLTALRELGVKWAASPQGALQLGGVWYPIRRGSGYEMTTPDAQITGPGGTPLSQPSSLGLAGGFNLVLNAKLNLLAQNGEAVILAQPQLSARNGSKASFLAGGEIPYVAIGANGAASVLFKAYGVRLDIEPRVDATGAIRANIETEVSAIDPTVSAPAGPALRTRRTSTEFNVREGGTIVLSGLLSREQSTDIDKLPLLGDLPVVGAMFRSKRFSNKETELVVFVTPKVVSADMPAMADKIERTEQQMDQLLGPRLEYAPPDVPAVPTPPAAMPSD